jgi:hypothetical protein
VIRAFLKETTFDRLVILGQATDSWLGMLRYALREVRRDVIKADYRTSA